MRLFTLIFVSILATVICSGQPVSGQGTIVHHVISGTRITAPRNVDVWLPADYDTTRSYAVIYMNDGQMLFDSTTTWNKQEWGADEVATALMRDNSLKPCIIVGIWNRNDYRYTEYYPEKSLNNLSAHRRNKLVRKAMKGDPLGDEYLDFIVSDVKPFIDSHYHTLPDRKNTVIIGSSMGGLISLYAICEYPDVFGGAGCMSTHLPMGNVGFFRKYDNALARSFRKYLETSLPDPQTHRIYFDYGTATLDKWYGPYQNKADKVMRKAGYGEENWITLRFDGHDHSERSWNQRLHIPMSFLLK